MYYLAWLGFIITSLGTLVDISKALKSEKIDKRIAFLVAMFLDGALSYFFINYLFLK